MAFNFGAGAAAVGGSGSAQAELGLELPDISTEEIGFKGVDRDCHIRFLPTPWPDDALPAPTSSLMTVAPTKGLVVGGGPDGLVVATTKSVRDAISAPAEEGVKRKPFQPQALIPLSSRPSQIAFCVAESALAVSTESDHRVAVYDASTLLQGNPQPQISIPTNGALRALAPNPAPASEPLSSYVALVTTNGELLLADLKAGSLVNGGSGPVLRSGVASVAWSNKGKQLVAGLADGSCVQLDPKGAVKVEIPRPPGLEANKHVSSIAWLETNVFLNVYTSSEVEDDMGGVPASDYYIVQRRTGAPFLFQKLPEVCAPFGLKRTPAYHFITRLKDFKPHLQDVLIISSTAAGDLGLITRSTHPLTDSMDAAKITNVFTSTTVATEVRQAALPLTENSAETSTIGLGVDLSSTDIVEYPIHGSDLAAAATPQPNVLVLNNEGILASWWFIYSESIRQNTPYHGLSAVQGVQHQPLQPALAPQTATPAASASGFGSLQVQKQTFGEPSFGQSAFGSSQTQSPTLGKPPAPAFGSPSPLGGTSQPAFGAPSALGGASSFGSSTAMKPALPAFGSPSTLGNPAPQFGQTGFGGTQNPSPSFGLTPGLGGKGFSSFASPGAGQSPIVSGAGAGAGGFSAFASGGGFGALASSKPAESPFAIPTTDSPFGKPSTSVFGSQPDTSSPFGSAQKTSDATGGFRIGSGGFVLGSSFKPDEKAQDNHTAPAQSSGAFSMGTSFSNLLTGSTAEPSPAAESMDDMEDEPVGTQQPQPPKSIFDQQSSFGTTQSPITAPPATSGPMFGTQSQSTTTPAAAQSSRPTTLFGNGTTTTMSASPLSSPSENTIVPSLSFDKDQKTPVAQNGVLPLPPDATSRAVYGPGDTSASSNVSKSSYEEAPLPPDFTKKSAGTKNKVDDAPFPPEPKKPGKDVVNDAPLPPDFLTTPKKTDSAALDDAPLPPDFLPTSKPKSDAHNQRLPVKEESIALPSGSEGSDGDFEDSGEEITHDVSPPSESAEFESASFKTSPESSFGGPSLKNSTGGLFTTVTRPDKQQEPEKRTGRHLFGEILQPNLPPPKPRSGTKSPRSPSPVRPGTRRDFLRPEPTRSISAPGGPERAFGARKATFGKPTVSRFEEPLSSGDLIEEEESKAAAAEIKRLASEAQTLSSDDEDERLRADLARPLSPVPSLDPFVPRQEYIGESFKPGIPGQIERLYRDINSMVDTLGLNSRSISSYLLHEEQTRKSSLETWKHIMLGDSPLDILDEDLAVSDIDYIDKLLDVLQDSLEQQRVRGVQEKLDECQRLISRDILPLRGQCASIQKTLDSYTDVAAVRSAPLSAEQATLQQDLRKSSTAIQSQLADLEQAVSLLRAKIADASRHDGANGSVSAGRSTKKPTVEAVTSTISTMMSMAENKSSDIDVLESQMKKLGLDLQGPSNREGSPLPTPLKKIGFRVPATPDSDRQSSYHTPESTSRFRSSLNGSARRSRFGAVNNFELDLISGQDSGQWKARTQRRKEIIGNLKTAVERRQVKVRTLDDV